MKWTTLLFVALCLAVACVVVKILPRHDAEGLAPTRSLIAPAVRAGDSVPPSSLVPAAPLAGLPGLPPQAQPVTAPVTAGANRLGATRPAVEPEHPLEPYLAKGELMDCAQAVPDADGVWEDVRLVRVEGATYPLLRVVDTRRGPDLSTAPVNRLAMAGDHVLVQVREGRDEEFLAAVAAREDLFVRATLYGRHDYLVAAVRADVSTVPSLAESLSALPSVVQAEPDFVRYFTATPDDTDFSSLWGMHNTGQSGGTPDADIDAPEAWDIYTGSPDTVVAVIDSGVLTTHLDLSANIWQNPGETGTDGLGQDKRTNKKDDDGNGLIDDVVGWDFDEGDNVPNDLIGHGTHVAGTVGAVGNNGRGVAGVCWTVKMICLKIGFGVSFDSIASSSIRYAADKQARAINASWGGPGYSAALYNAIGYARSAGVVFVAAAGNSWQNTDYYPMYPASYNLDNIISVAALDRNDDMAWFSNYGATTVDLGAPGEEIYSTTVNGSYGEKDGTSMASPHVMGACGLLAAVNPGLTGPEIRQRLFDTVVPVPALAGVTVTGGRLNIYQAVRGMNSPYIKIDGIRAADPDAAPLLGNGDGYANPGEVIGLDVMVKNVGIQDGDGVTATLTQVGSDPYFTILEDSGNVGAVASGATSTVVRLFRIELGTPGVLPHSGQFKITFAATSHPGPTWVSDATITIFLPAEVCGRVTRVATGAGIPGATVSYSGPVVGTVTTDANGDYQMRVVAGSFNLTATAAGLIPSDTRSVSVPPNLEGVDFAIGAVKMRLKLPRPDMLMYPGEQHAVPLMIANDGDSPTPLSYAMTVTGDLGAGDPHLFTLSGSPTAVTTLAERRVNGTTLFTSTVNVSSLGAGLTLKMLAYDGDYLYILGSKTPSLHTDFFLYKRRADNGAAVGVELALDARDMKVIRLTADEGGLLLFGTPYGEFGVRSYRINLATGQLVIDRDYGTLAIDNIAMAYPRRSVFIVQKSLTEVTVRELRKKDLAELNSFSLGNVTLSAISYSGGNKELYILLSGSPIQVRRLNPDTGAVLGSFTLTSGFDVHADEVPTLRWLTVDPLSGTVDAGAETNVALQLDSYGLANGSYSAEIVLESNDPEAPLTVIPVNIHVTEVPGYEAWRAEKFAATPAPGDGYMEDPDTDGALNVFEFLHGSEPKDSLVGDGFPQPTGLIGGAYTFEFLCRKGLPPGLLVFQLSSDLEAWLNGVEGNDYDVLNREDVDTFYDRLTIGVSTSSPSLFMRPAFTP